MSPTRKKNIHEWAPTRVGVVMLLTSAIGAITTYAKTGNKVETLTETSKLQAAEIKALREEQSKANAEIAGRLGRIEGALGVKSAWADREYPAK